MQRIWAEPIQLDHAEALEAAESERSERLYAMSIATANHESLHYLDEPCRDEYRQRVQDSRSFADIASTLQGPSKERFRLHGCEIIETRSCVLPTCQLDKICVSTVFLACITKARRAPQASTVEEGMDLRSRLCLWMSLQPLLQTRWRRREEAVELFYVKAQMFLVL